mgnify:CR=1 FL=1
MRHFSNRMRQYRWNGALNSPKFALKLNLIKSITMRKLAFFLTIAGAVLMMGCSEDPMTNPDPTATLKGAKKPMPKLVGTTQEFFNPAFLEGSPYMYVGTIDFRDCGLGVYNFAYDFAAPPEPKGTQVLSFVENFTVYEGDIEDNPTILMRGTNSGVIVKVEKFFTNGTVNMACGPFEGWEGRKVHVDGTVVVPPPFPGGPALELESTFRIN